MQDVSNVGFIESKEQFMQILPGDSVSDLCLHAKETKIENNSIRDVAKFGNDKERKLRSF